MTCQYCETWVRDDDYRCPRCSRRVRATPVSAFPVVSSATAHAYNFALEEERAPEAEPAGSPAQQQSDQQRLFSQPINSPRVVSLDAWKNDPSRGGKQPKPDRVAGERPAPIETGKVELRRARPSSKRTHQNQTTLDLFSPEVVSQPQPSIICDAPVAPISLRIRAALVDGSLMLAGCAAVGLLFWLSGGRLRLDRQVLLFAAFALVTVPVFYKILWMVGGRDTIGMQLAHLRLVDFDGNPPSQKRRYLRLFGSVVSLLAAGIGLVWSFVDEDALTWHDHISETFPTPVGDEAEAV
ncbi:MAG TPA: RDD family protein [Bryobacteraceae bacterium]|jgi:uncharacterized RDD family membrane protein YckC|nr:RDD family protein [Bryobacteraceae bacterium]